MPDAWAVKRSGARQKKLEKSFDMLMLPEMRLLPVALVPVSVRVIVCKVVPPEIFPRNCNALEEAVEALFWKV